MKLFPNNYYRVIHFTDPCPDIPSMFFGFKHAGTEIWYYSPLNADLSYKECSNRAYDPENRDCSHTLFMRPFLEDHRYYLNEKISFICTNFVDPTLLMRHDLQIKSLLEASTVTYSEEKREH